MRELVWSLEARRQHDWSQTSEVLATMINVGARKHVVSAHQLNPCHQRKLQPPTLDELAGMLEP